MTRRPPRSTRVRSSAASDVYKRQDEHQGVRPTERTATPERVPTKERPLAGERDRGAEAEPDDRLDRPLVPPGDEGDREGERSDRDPDGDEADPEACVAIRRLHGDPRRGQGHDGRQQREPGDRRTVAERLPAGPGAADGLGAGVTAREPTAQEDERRREQPWQ